MTPYIPILKRVLGCRGPIRSIMDIEENKCYDALPETVTVYRGCSADATSGLCWTLDEQVANSFPFLTRFKATTPVVIRARAKKDRILAVKLDRNETEVITFSPRPMSVKPADEVAARAFLAARSAKWGRRAGTDPRGSTA